MKVTEKIKRYRLIIVNIVLMLLIATGSVDTASADTGRNGLTTIELSVTDYDGTMAEYFEEHSEEYSDKVIVGYRPKYSSLPINSAGSDGPEMESRFGYRMLESENQKKLYEAMLAAAEDYHSSEAFSAKDIASADDAAVAVAALEAVFEDINDVWEVTNSFLNDYPEYFWIDGNMTATRFATGVAVNFGVDSYYWRAAERVRAEKAVDYVSKLWLSEIMALSDNNVSTFDDTYLMAMKAHDLIIEAIDYLYVNGSPSPTKSAHSIGGVFTGDGAVCEGYAKAFQYMLDLAGIRNIYITGMADGGGHAWNAVEIGDKYYLVDVTWDDKNNGNNCLADCIGFYEYFCIPADVFNESHTAFTPAGEYWLYELPDFAQVTDYVYCMKYQSYAAQGLTGESVGAFVESAIIKAPGDYIYFTSESKDDFALIARELSVSSWSYYEGCYGYVFPYKNIKIEKPAGEITLSDFEKTISVGEFISVSAVLNGSDDGAECDDRVVWRLSSKAAASLISFGDTAIIGGKKDGKVTLTATSADGSVKAECIIIIGEGKGADTGDYVIWAGGNKHSKSVTLSPTINASTWQDAKGKTKNGKLVWVIATEETEISFDMTKHKVLTKSNKSLASVNAKGVVSAKKAGIVYVYVCDTGSCTYEQFAIEIRQAPSKLQISSVAGSTDKKDLVKKAYIDAGSTAKLFISPTAKNTAVSEAVSYKVSFAKPELAKYLAVSEIKTDGSGNNYFEITGKPLEKTMVKPQVVKLVITNNESGKKVNVSVSVGNSVIKVNTSVKGSLKEKKDTAVLTLSVDTAAGSGFTTTDKYKLYVAKTEAGISDKKVTYDKGATVKAKLDKSTGKIILTAGADAGTTAVVYMLYTNPVTKTMRLIKLASVDEAGNVTAVSAQ